MTDESRPKKTSNGTEKVSRRHPEPVRDAVEALRLAVADAYRGQAPPLCKKIRRIENA